MVQVSPQISAISVLDPFMIFLHATILAIQHHLSRLSLSLLQHTLKYVWFQTCTVYHISLGLSLSLLLHTLKYVWFQTCRVYHIYLKIFATWINKFFGMSSHHFKPTLLRLILTVTSLLTFWKQAYNSHIWPTSDNTHDEWMWDSRLDVKRLLVKCLIGKHG